MTIDIAKLKKLEAEASPAPWWQDDIESDDGHGPYTAYCVGYEHRAILDTSNSDVQLIEQDDGPRYDITGHRDTEFIFEMRNATPAMIARIEKLEAALKKIAGEAPAKEPRDEPTVAWPPNWSEDLRDMVNDMIQQAWGEGHSRGKWEASVVASDALK